MRQSIRQLAGISALAIGAFLLVSCGREAPYFAPNPSPGDLAVFSNPSGAAIFLDGLATGSVTPDTLQGLDAGDHVIRLELWGHDVSPESLVVTVAASATVEADFAFTPAEAGPPPIVLLEGFSNVSCVGCPEMASTVHSLMSNTMDYGPDRVLLIKISTDFPAISDPFYQANIEDNQARWRYYVPVGQTASIPILRAQGSLLGEQGNPPIFADLVDIVDDLLAGDTGLQMTVSATVGGLEIPVTATVSATRHVDLTGCSLHVALVEKEVYLRDIPGIWDTNYFYWVMRDFITATSSLDTPGQHRHVEVQATLQSDPEWIPGELAVIAFIQHNQTQVILQAGSTVSGSPAPGAAAATHRSLTHPVTPCPGGKNP